MLNEFNVGTKRIRGGYLAVVRLPADADFRPLLAKGGVPALYGSELDAHKAATRFLLRYINGNLVRSGEKVGKALAAAEALFSGQKKAKRKTITLKKGGHVDE